MAAGGSGSTYVITADASQAIAEFRRVSKAALETEQIKGAGTPIAGPKFQRGLFSAATREAEEFRKDLERIGQAIKQLEGQKLPKDFFPGFKGGTAAQAAQFRGILAQQNIAAAIGTKSAAAGISVPKDLVTKLTTQFQTSFQGVANSFLKNLQQKVPTALEAIGTTRQVQLAQGNRTVQGAAEGARTTVLNRKEAARVQAEQDRADKVAAKAQEQADRAAARAQARADRIAEEERQKAARRDERNRQAQEARDRKAADKRQQEEDRAAAQRQAIQGVQATKSTGVNQPLNFAGGSAQLPIPPVVSVGSPAGVAGTVAGAKRQANQLSSQLTASARDALVDQQHAADQQRINASNLREANKALAGGVFQAANDVVVDFRNGYLQLFDRTRHGEQEIRPNDPAFPSALEGALRTRQQAFDYVEGQRRTNTGGVTDLGNGLTAVKDATTGALNFFSAIQDGSRQLITGRAEAERAFTRYEQIMQDRANFDRVEANRARNPDKVIPVGQGRVVDTTSGQPLAFKPVDDGGGLRELNARQSRRAIRQADEILAARDLKNATDRERAARPQDFVGLGKNAFADIGNQQIAVYKNTKAGVEAVAKGSEELREHLKALGQQIRTLPTGENVPLLLPRTAATTSGSEREDKLLRDAERANRRVDEGPAREAEQLRNAAHLRDSATGLVNPGVIQFGQYLADLRGPTLELYKDFVRLGHASTEYARTQGRLVTNLARQSRPGIGGAIVSGLVGGFGSEGGSATGIIEGLAKSGVTTAKYAALGTVLYGLSSAAAQAFSELQDFDDSLVELEVAFQRTGVTGQSFLNDLADSASESGANVGEAMDVAASAVRAFGNTTTDVGSQSTEQLQIMAASFAKEASRIALLTKTSLTDAAGNLKAIALGFKVPDSGFSRVTDALANAKIVGGGDEKQIGQGVANISVAAKEAGFSLEEIGNIVSDIVAKTDQGGQLVAQRLTRAFSIIGGQAGQAAIRRLNAQLPTDQRISQSKDTTPAEQIKQLSAVYGNLSESQRKLLNNQLGGTANARELIILLEDANRLTSEASLDAAGKGAEEYEKRLKNIRALITQITGNIKNLISAVGNSGLLAPLGLVLKTTLLIAQVARTLVETFDRIPSIVRNIAGVLVGILVTSRAIAAIRDAGGVKGFIRQIEERYTPGRAYARTQLEVERKAQEAANGIGIVGTNAQKIKAEKDALAARRQARADLFNVAQPVKGGPIAGKLNDASLRVDKTLDRLRDFRDRAVDSYNTAQKSGASRYDSLIAAGSTPYNPGRSPVPRSQRVSAAFTSGRAQLNASGAFGALGIAGAGIATIASIGEANKRIQHAVNEFGRLRDLPQSFGVDDLKDSAANLRSAAKALRESSSGIIGTVVNFLQGDPTGKAAKEATERADAADTARKIIENARKRASLSSNPEDISSAIDFSSDDALSASIDALGKSGRDATTQMDAFQAALQGIDTAGEKATRKLTETENLTIAGRVGDLSVTNFQNALKLNPQGSFSSGEGLSVTGFGRRAPNLAAVIDTVTAGHRALRGDTKEVSALKKVDTGLLQTRTSGIVSQLLNTGGFDINSKAGQELLRRQLNDSYKTLIPNDDVRKQVTQQVITDVVAQTKDVRSVNDSTASFANLAAAIPGLASAKAAQAVVNNSLATSATGSTSATGARKDISAGLQSTQVELGELQLGLKNLESKTDGSEEDNRQLDLLRSQVAAKKVEVAEATVANMEAVFTLYEASKPPENTVQNLKDTLSNIDAELAVPGISPDTERSLKSKRAQIEQQLPAAQIADNIATQRVSIDSRDTLGNDQLDIDQTNAELEDFKTRGVTGKALADKQKQLEDQKRKFANDQANLALSERIAASPIGSALQDAKNNLDAAQVNLDQQLVGTEAYNQAKRALDASKVSLADAAIADSQANFQLSQSTKPTENTTANLQAEAAELQKELTTKDIGSDAARAIQTQLNALYPQITASIIADTYAGLRAGTDSRDVVGLDKINVQQIEAELADFRARGVEGKALADKQVELADARRKLVDDEKDVALQQKIATFDPNSAVDQATTNLLTAAENLRKAEAGTAEYAKAQAAYKKAVQDDAQAKLDAASDARSLRIDLSNPVQVAKEATKKAEAELRQARADNESPDVINKKILTKRQAQLTEDATIFDAFLTAAQNADSLGDISHRAYIDLLNGRLIALQAEAALLDPNSNGAKQVNDQIIRIRQAIKSAGDELSGQFNIGDIKIPTPYQVRRAIKAGSTGSILAANSPNSTAGNVTNDTSTKSVVLNGIPIQQVLTLIEDLFGIKAKTKNNGRKKP